MRTNQDREKREGQHAILMAYDEGGGKLFAKVCGASARRDVVKGMRRNPRTSEEAIVEGEVKLPARR